MKQDITTRDAEQEWKRLKKGIEEIQDGNASKLRFEELYRNAYTLVLHKHGTMLYNGVKKTIEARLKTIVKKVKSATNNLLVKRCTEEWDGHKVKMAMIRDILMYMDKTHCEIKKKTGVHELGLLKFKEIVIQDENVLGRLKSELLGMVDRERQGQVIEVPLLRAALLMFVDADPLAKKNSAFPVLYREHFEKDFLEQTRNFYKIESQAFLENNTVPDYLRKVQTRLKEEQQRQENYLDATTQSHLREVCETELIVNHAEKLVLNQNTGAAYMFKEKKIRDMGRMYGLLRRKKQCLEPLKKALRDFIFNRGCMIVDDDQNKKTPDAFVGKMLELRRTSYNFFEQSFMRDASFGDVIKKSMEEFVNKDMRPARFLSSHADLLLRSGFEKMNDSEVAEAMDNIICIFQYINDKDIFEDVYKQHLAQRLLHQKSQSDSNEKSMLAKLKAECGHQFTSKMEGMFKDIRTSRDLRDRWRQYQVNNNIDESIELNTNVLTSGFWPFNTTDTCKLPEELIARCEHFKNFYTQTHSGRKIKFNTSKGTAELLVKFPGGSKQLIVSTAQMCILMMFNHKTTVTYAEIKKHTQIQPDELDRHLLSLAHPKVKVLGKNPNTKRVEDNHSFRINTKYRNNKFRVRINLIGKKTSVGKPVIPEGVVEARKNIVEAAVVRIMKSRKQLAHNDLIREVIHQLSSRFNPQPLFIKKRIESLIEREYLERDSENRKIYNYKA